MIWPWLVALLITYALIGAAVATVAFGPIFNSWVWNDGAGGARHAAFWAWSLACAAWAGMFWPATVAYRVWRTR